MLFRKSNGGKKPSNQSKIITGNQTGKDTYKNRAKDPYFQRKDSNFYPYIDWTVAHFHHTKRCLFSEEDYPFTWETEASQTNYKGMNKIKDRYASAKTSSSHTWQTAEMFLCLLELKK